MGYANEVGESFRPLVHKHWVTASYGVATLYVLADTADKTVKADKKEKTMPIYRTSKVVAAAADTLIWQSLASVIIPGFTINRICALTLFSLTKFTKLPAPTKKWTTTAVGLGSIPFIVKPIDTFVDFVLDKLMRPFFSETLKKNSKGNFPGDEEEGKTFLILELMRGARCQKFNFNNARYVSKTVKPTVVQ